MLAEKDKLNIKTLKELGISPFKPRFPWIGGDLQTLRDSLRPERLLKEGGTIHKIPVPALSNKPLASKEYYLNVVS